MQLLLNNTYKTIQIIPFRLWQISLKEKKEDPECVKTQLVDKKEKMSLSNIFNQVKNQNL